MQGHLEKMEILERRDKKSGQSLTPLVYSWVNITCHVRYFTVIIEILAWSSVVVRPQLILSADDCVLRAVEQ